MNGRRAAASAPTRSGLQTALGAAGLIAALLACGKTNLAETHPQLLVTPASLDFGTVAQHTPGSQSLVLENGGQAVLDLTSATIDGAQAALFSLGAAPPAQLAGGASFTLPVLFTPVSAGAASATLHLASNDPTTPVFDVPLSGTGGETGSLSVSPMSLDFGRVGEGESKVLPIELTSGGPAALYLASLALSPADAGFSLVGSAVTPAQLAAGATAQLAVVYAPLPGAEATAADLIIDSSDPDTPSLQIPLAAQVDHAPIPVATGQIPPASPLATSMTAPLGSTIILDGSASSDPDGDTPLTYAWTLATRPENSAAAIGAPASVTTQITVDVAGVYTVQLAVTDSTGLVSLAPATLEIQALPPVQMQIELTWDEQRPDLDLHLLQSTSAQLGSTGDCGWTNPDPAWFPGGADDNPRYQGDALVGYGPELIDWKTPQPGTFEIAVVYKDANGLSPATTQARVRVFAFGVLVGELTAQLLNAGDVWRAGTIAWPSGQVVASSADGGVTP